MRTVALIVLMTGCTYLENRADCNQACGVLFSETECAVPTDEAGVGPKTAVFACTQVCVDEEPSNRDAFLDCVSDNTCASLTDGACDPQDFTGAAGG